MRCGPQKGFPDSATLEDVTELFSEFGTVGRVFMRRFPGKQRRFKVRHCFCLCIHACVRVCLHLVSDARCGRQGSVFVTFEKKEAATKAVEGEVKFMGRPLSKVMMKTAYLELKAAERKKRGESKEGDNDGGDAVHAVRRLTPRRRLVSSLTRRPVCCVLAVHGRHARRQRSAAYQRARHDVHFAARSAGESRWWWLKRWSLLRFDHRLLTHRTLW